MLDTALVGLSRFRASLGDDRQCQQPAGGIFTVSTKRDWD